jgi:hypothetical protein
MFLFSLVDAITSGGAGREVGCSSMVGYWIVAHYQGILVPRDAFFARPGDEMKKYL